MIDPPWFKPGVPVLRLGAARNTDDDFISRVFQIAMTAAERGFLRSRPMRRIVIADQAEYLNRLHCGGPRFGWW